MFCHKCGAQLNENAVFCHNCGASVGGFDTNNSAYGAGTKKMSKKEYFKSGYCTDEAKRHIKTNWILYSVLCTLLIVSLVGVVTLMLRVSDMIDSDISFVGFLEAISDITGSSLNLTEEAYEIFEQSDIKITEMGMTLEQFFEYLIAIIVGSAVFAISLMLIFLTVSVIRKSTGFAVTSLIFAILNSASWVIIGLNIAILVLTVKLNREYKDYCNYYTVFPSDGMSNNEPDFS